MKTSALLIAIVVALHCAALGALFFIQGCGTTARTGTPPPATMPTMPPTTKEAVTYPPSKPSEKVSAVKSESKELPKAQETTEYIVRSGDSVGSIAKQYGISRSEIAELNKLTDPNKLRVGQKLMLPGRLKIKAASAAPAKSPKKAEKAAAAAPVEVSAPNAPADVTAPAAPAEITASAAGKEYVVQKGDSLSKIAKKCGVKIKALREANKLQGDKLKVGQKLIIPEASAASAAPVAPAAPAAATPAAPIAPMTISVPAESAATPATPAASTPAAPAAPTASMTIPAPAESAAPAAAPAAATSATGSGITHIVQPSEDINSIAKLYAVTVDEITELNQLGANRTVKVGQRLKIP